MKVSLRPVLGLALSLVLAVCVRAQTPLGSGFTYQGELASAGLPVSGTYDIRFRLYDAAAGGNQVGVTLCSDNLAIVNGRFSASLDFGAVFTGQKRWLEIEVRQDSGLDCSDATGYTILSPRQELTGAPNAVFAQSAATASNAANLNGQPPTFFTNAANLTGTLADAQLSENIARLDSNQTFTGLLNLTNAGNMFMGNGAGLTNLSGASINAGTVARSSLSADVQGGVGRVGNDLWLAGSVATGDRPFSVAVSGSFAYVVDYNVNTLQVFNVSSPSTPTLAGSVSTGNRPTAVAVSGSYAYVVNYLANTLQVFNISNPTAPTLAASVATGSFPQSVVVSGSFAYVANAGSYTLQVFNITIPAAPTLAGSTSTDSGPSSLAVSGSFAYVTNGSSNTLQVFNISNPATPTLAGRVATGNTPRSVAVSGSLACVVNQFGSSLQVFNISNPAAPTLAGSATTGSNPFSVAVSGSSAYVVNLASNTLQVFDIGTPGGPTLAATIGTSFQPVCVTLSGAFAYVANQSSNTLQVFNTAVGVVFGAPLAASSLAGVNGSGLTGVNAASLNGQTGSFYTNASNLTSGTLGIALIPNLDASKITTGTLGAALIPNLDASKITTGTLGAGLIPNLDASKITTGTLDAALIPNLDASKLTTGTLADTRLSVNVARTNGPNAFGNFFNTFAGNVGIGTTSPGARLHVTGPNGSAFQVNDYPVSPSTQLVATLFGNAAGPQLRFQRAAGGSFIDIGQNGTNDFVVETNDTARLIVSSSTGNVQVVNALSKGGGSFKIDHPLDPENKYLYHSFVESPDMMNVYNGIVVLDGAGTATVELPDYFEALNRDFRYQLTCVGGFAPVYIARKVEGNSFAIAGGLPGLEVSWQVTGIRKDAWAEKNRIPNAVEKTGAEKGKLLHPEAFGKPAGMGVFAGPEGGK